MASRCSVTPGAPGARLRAMYRPVYEGNTYLRQVHERLYRTSSTIQWKGVTCARMEDEALRDGFVASLSTAGMTQRMDRSSTGSGSQLYPCPVLARLGFSTLRLAASTFPSQDSVNEPPPVRLRVLTRRSMTHPRTVASRSSCFPLHLPPRLSALSG